MLVDPDGIFVVVLGINVLSTIIILQFQVISATLPDITTVDFWAEPREKSFGQRP